MGHPMSRNDLTDEAQRALEAAQADYKHAEDRMHNARILAGNPKLHAHLKEISRLMHLMELGSLEEIDDGGDKPKLQACLNESYDRIAEAAGLRNLRDSTKFDRDKYPPKEPSSAPEAGQADPASPRTIVLIMGDGLGCSVAEGDRYMNNMDRGEALYLLANILTGSKSNPMMTQAQTLAYRQNLNPRANPDPSDRHPLDHGGQRAKPNPPISVESDPAEVEF